MNAADEQAATDEVLHRRRPNPKIVADLLALPRAVNPAFGDALDATMQLLLDQNEARARIITRLRAEIRRRDEQRAAPDPADRAVLVGGRAQGAPLDPFAHPGQPVHGPRTAHAALRGARPGALVAACNPGALTLDARLIDAYRWDPSVRCRQPACATVFSYADARRRRELSWRPGPGVGAAPAPVAP